MAFRVVFAAAAIAALHATRVDAASSVCGNVNDNGDVSTTDALLVLKTAVGQDTMLVCDAAPLTTTFGYTTDFVTSHTVLPDHLLGLAVEIDTASSITHFGVIAKGGGQSARFALYTDANGTPADLVIGTSATVLAEGMQEIPVPATLVGPGTYWLMAVYNAEATPGSDLASQGAWTSRELPFGDPFPDPFGVGGVQSGTSLNYWVKAQLPP